MNRAFSVNISSIRGFPGSRQDVDVSGELEGLAVTGSAVAPGSKVGFRGAVEAMEAGTGVVAVGTVTGRWQGECRRCLGPAEGIIEQPVREIFETEATEGETYALDGDVVDLEPLVRETVMLELPEAPLCRPNCAGLCPECGVNLNENPGHRHAPPADPRWAALDALKDVGDA